jgi:hypothetical protein
MRTSLGTTDKALLRRILVALASSRKALDLDTIADASSAVRWEVEELLEYLMTNNLVVERSRFYAISPSLNGFDSWAESVGDEAFAGRKSVINQERSIHEAYFESFIEKLLKHKQIGPEEASEIVLSVRAEFQQHSVSKPKEGRSSRKSDVRAIIFTLAEYNVALTEDEIQFGISPTGASILTLWDLVKEGIVGQNGPYFALSRTVGGVDYWAESSGDMAFEFRESYGAPTIHRHLYASAARPPSSLSPWRLLTHMASEGRISDELVGQIGKRAISALTRPHYTRHSLMWISDSLHAWLRPPNPQRQRRHRSAWPAGLQVKTDSGAALEKQERRYQWLKRIVRFLPIPPPPRPVVMNVFGEDLRDAENVLDELLARVGPPPEWNGRVSGGE